MVNEIKDFYLSKLDQLYNDKDFRQGVLQTHQHLNIPDRDNGGRESFIRVLNQYLEEASLTLSLIEPLETWRDKSLLEVGGGLGLVYAFLKSRDYHITALEPSAPGFDGCYRLALLLFKELDIDGSDFHPLTAEECPKLNKQFDLVFSNNVFEHVSQLAQCLAALKLVLKPEGKMIHNTVNYLVPYEPHFKMLLVPFFPALTSFFNPGLKKHALWNDLNFVTTFKLRKICRALGLAITFDNGALLRTLLRFETDPGFAARQRIFFGLYQMLKKIGLMKMIKMIPASLTTPITFTLTKNN